MKRETFFDGGAVLFLDQHGRPIWAHSRKELCEKVPGKVVDMYVDKKDGSTVRAGYVIGVRWLTAFKPLELPA